MKFTNVVVHNHNKVTATRTGFWFSLFKNVFNWREEYRWECHVIDYHAEWYLIPERTRVNSDTWYMLTNIVDDHKVWGTYGNGNS